MNPWLDVSTPLRAGMAHWPGDPPFHIERLADQMQGDSCTVSTLALSAHTGTHMDAPLHYLPGASPIDAMPLDAAIGPARVIQIRGDHLITPAQLAPHNIAPGERILLRTANSDRAPDPDHFHEDFVALTAEAALYLAERHIRTLGIDSPSVGGFLPEARGPETHQALLAAEIWLIEGLQLRHIEPGDYDLICLPIKLVGADGAPARAVLRRRQKESPE